MRNVIVSPHVSGDVEGWEARVVEVFVDNARRWAAGEPLVNRVDKAAGHGESEPSPGAGDGRRGLPPGPAAT
jgi:hypothetical protein